MPTLARRSSNMSLFRFFSQGITNELASSTKKDPCSFPMMRYCFLSIMSGHLQPDLLLNSMTSPCTRSVLLFLITCCSITSYVIQDCFLNSRSSSRITSPKTATRDKDLFKTGASFKIMRFLSLLTLQTCFHGRFLFTFRFVASVEAYCMLEISFTVRIHSFVCHDCNSKLYKNWTESFPSRMVLILFKTSEKGDQTKHNKRTSAYFEDISNKNISYRLATSGKDFTDFPWFPYNECRNQLVLVSEYIRGEKRRIFICS